MRQAAAQRTIAEELGDFTTTWRVIPISLLAIVIGLLSTGVAVVLLQADCALHQSLLLPALEHGPGLPGRKPSRCLRGARSGGRCAGHRLHGTLRVGAHSRARHSGSDRVDPHQRQPGTAAPGDPEADFVRHFDRFGRTLRRRRADHHDRRRTRLDGRAVLSPHGQRAQDTAGGGSRGGNVGDVRSPGGRRAAGGRTAALRVEASQLRARGTRQRDGRSGSRLPAGPRARCFRCRITAWRCHRRPCSDVPWPEFSREACPRC